MPKTIIINKFAKSDYEIHSTYQVGISLLGWEVKSLRAKNAKLENAFCSISNKNELWLNNLYISQYMLVKGQNDRSRKLLMHKYEILRLKNKADSLGLIIIPLQIYWLNNHIKLEIALAKKLRKYDKREKIKQEEIKRNLKIVY
ncbi:SsrA-binding protein SmpB [Mycoplasma struthionis]|uniref:SsrA-binding protein n=1 Tax=Mycoplasma struthionis TaxID=538220 RepID=A0A502M205_9MOLU|nr:SsrA-binding protein SmpB [Mycoplasma struthionis]TPI01485.1 SsrA-binding protein SmpB [Mycoplasma struthionis]